MISTTVLWFALALGIRSVAAISTGNDYVYHDIGRALPSTGNLVFKLKACNDALIALSTTAGSYDSNTYEIVIGGWNNERCALRRCKQCFNEANPMTIDILNCDEYRDFWVSWGDGQISMGTGLNVGQSAFMSYTDPNPYTIQAAAVSTGWGATGEWLFLDEAWPDVLIPSVESTMSTGDDYVYHDIGQTLPPTGNLLFSVKACNDAFIALSTTAESYESNTYEIVIGGWGNDRCAIRRCKQCDAQVDPITPGILNCDEYRAFWVSWGNSRISVGSGSTVGENELMSYTDPNPYTIQAAAVATGWGATGEWLFSTWAALPISSVESTMSTDDDYVYQDIGQALPTTGNLVFKVKACNDAFIALSTTAWSYDSNTYEILIGGWNNDRCAIRRCRECNPQANPITPGILNCDEYRAFWLSWGNSRISVGSGTTVGESELMSYIDPNPYTIQAAAVATGWDATGEWIFMA